MENEMNNGRGEALEIDLCALLAAVLRKSWLVAIAAVLGAALMFAYTFFLVTPMYQAETKFYVNNKDNNSGNSSNMTSSDLTVSRNLVDSYIGILETRETMNQVIDYVGEQMDHKTLLDMVSAKAVGNTEIFKVTVESANPAQAERLANAIAYVLPLRISTIIEGTSVKIVEAATLPTSPSSPSYVKNILLGFAVGLMLAVAVIVIREITDITIRKEEDVAQVCRYPVLTAVPDMNASGKGGGYYTQSKKNTSKTADKATVLMGSHISFAASEAYKLLRTKLQFSFAGENASRVIGVSSSLSGEGKSLSSVNLAYALSDLGKKVILLDCDMRRPTLAEKLGINKTPGLSSYLTGQSDLASLVQRVGNEDKGFYVISAGQNPPNPSELLSSARMHEGLLQLRKDYDYVIMDMPPVSDAVAIAPETDGLLLIVRGNYCDQQVLADVIAQFEYVKANILGVVFNCVDGRNSQRYYLNTCKRGIFSIHKTGAGEE